MPEICAIPIKLLYYSGFRFDGLITPTLRAIEAVKETLEDRKLRETERYRFVASILDSGATPDGQIVMVSVFLPLIEAVRQRQVLNRNDPVLTPIFAIK